MKYFLMFCIIFLYIIEIKANSINGTVLDENNKPIEYCNIVLHKYSDESYINGTTTDSNGYFEIKQLQQNNYYLEILYVGYKNDTIENINIEDNEPKQLGQIVLKVEENTLKDVVVSASRPVIERKADRLVYNVENSAKASGENVMDLLRSVPGITVSGNDQIRINGKDQIQVMINGKVEQMNADQLANLLKSIQSSNVKNIEVISNPSAKYDAAAKGGILNIQLKTSLKSGVNGSVYANYRQHKFAGTDVGFNINANYKKFTFATSYNFSFNKGWHKSIYTRNFDLDTAIQKFDENAYSNDKSIGHFANLSMRYRINDKNTIGIGGEFSTFKNMGNSNSTLNVYNDILTVNEFNTYQKTSNKTEMNAVNPSANFNFRSQLDSNGSVLSINYDYTFYQLKSHTHLNTNYFLPNDTIYALPYDFTQDNPYIVHLHTAKIDYNKTLKGNHLLEVGAKFTWTKTNNDIQFKNLIGNNYVLDATKSNQFQYIENINAAYTTWSKEWKKGWSTNVGLRMEQTNTNQHSFTLNTTTKRNYIDFFPSAFIQKIFKEKHNLNLNYSRKIHRPNFDDLNPFEFYLSPYSIWAGNANLKPEYINVTELTYTFKNAYSFFIGHENIKNNYTHLVFQNDSTKISMYKASNFKVRNNLNIGVNINKELFKWWTISYSAQYTFFKYNSIVNDLPFVISSNKFSIALDNTFILPKNFTINIFAFYTTPHLDATDIMKSDGMVNISISKTFFDKKLKIRLAGNDIFGTKNFSFDTNFFNVNSITRNKFSSRFFSLSVIYNFQKGKKVQNNYVEKSNTEEKGRIGGR